MKKLALTLTCLYLSSCSSYSPFRPNETDISGAGSLIKENTNIFLTIDNSFSTIDYCKLLKQYGFAAKEDCVVEAGKLSQIDVKLRDEMQDHILAASNQKCGGYIRYLHSIKGDTDVFWGGLATLLAGAGSVISYGPTAQAFSAGGAVSSGIRAEFNQAYFANLAIEVMTAGINSRRTEILQEIYKRRGNSGDEHYSLNGAVRDALKYHSACTAVTGFEVAAQSISRADNPGAKELSKFIKDLKEPISTDSGTPSSKPEGTSAPSFLKLESDGTIMELTNK